MKNIIKFFSALFALLLVVATSIFIQSCSKVADNTNEGYSLKPREYQFLDTIITAPEGQCIWEAQLTKVIEHNYMMTDSELELLSYKYVGKVDDMNELERIKSEFICEKALFPIYRNEDSTGIFTIQKFGDMEKNDMDFFKTVMDDILPTSITAIKNASKHAYFFKPDDLSSVNLTWRYKGNILNTSCLVSDTKGFVYDNFLRFICFVRGNDSETVEQTVGETDTVITIPRLKVGSESCGCKNSFKYTFSKREVSGGWFGNDWEISIIVIVTGECNNGNVSIKGFSTNTSNEVHTSGYTCSANARTINYQMGKEGFYHFAWGWCGGKNISMSFGGYGFSISNNLNSGRGETGEKYITHGDL
jgi:hypothetical protein